ncbi:hypothetical protein GVN16_22375 [Emticicia sp. CRIBPO]|uniref:hypothetical protein n=1 Tax=Emticicia sp. CRIBPO TaxID=2683258 RepID=UPI0014123767|nr:hypothetical protein [Emticicia sp. CRIBPO]NBA88537.1 hypothetical protein [Emticicia sp. CRIBPO]
MKKFFLFFLISLTALNASAIGFTESHSLAKGKNQHSIVSNAVEKGRMLELPMVKSPEAEIETKTISTSIVGLVTDFFSRVFSIFFGDYMSLSLDNTCKTGLNVENC